MKLEKYLSTNTISVIAQRYIVINLFRNPVCETACPRLQKSLKLRHVAE